MNELVERLILKDYQDLIEIDGFAPSVAETIVYFRYLNGVYSPDNNA